MKLYIYFLGGKEGDIYITLGRWAQQHQEKSPTLMWIPAGKPAFIVCNVLLGKILFMTSFNLYISALEIKKDRLQKYPV